MTRARSVFALLLGLSFFIVLKLTVIDPARRSSPPSQRFTGALRTASDLLWVKVSSRLAFSERVPPKEAAENFRLTRVAARMNPENREPYRFGPIGLMLWNRSDLALRLAQEGILHFPNDTNIARSFMNVLLLSESRFDSAAYLRIVETAAGESNSQMTGMLQILRARKLENAGFIEKAIAAWKEIGERNSDDDFLAARATRESSRLNARLKAQAPATEAKMERVQ